VWFFKSQYSCLGDVLMLQYSQTKAFQFYYYLLNRTVHVELGFSYRTRLPNIHVTGNAVERKRQWYTVL